MYSRRRYLRRTDYCMAHASLDSRCRGALFVVCTVRFRSKGVRDKVVTNAYPTRWAKLGFSSAFQPRRSNP